MEEVKTFEILSKGRKYFECQIGRTKAKLVINGVSEGFKPGDTVAFVVADLSERSKYGTTLKFDPRAVADEATVAMMRLASAAEKWMGYAEADAASGRHSSNAISQAMTMASSLPTFADRLAALCAVVDQNRAAHELRQREWAREEEQQRRARDAEHAAKAQATRQHRDLFPLSDQPPLNEPVRWHGQVIVFESRGKSFRIDENHPSVFGSHLLGHEGDYGCYCYYRKATPDEITTLETAEAMQQTKIEARQHRENEIRRIAGHIKATGERPDGMNEPDGERLIDSQNVYGGGEWFVIGPEWIWYVQNNGVDGDNWSQNNVRTGGAGAIGWRIPFDQYIADTLRGLAET